MAKKRKKKSTPTALYLILMALAAVFTFFLSSVLESSAPPATEPPTDPPTPTVPQSPYTCDDFTLEGEFLTCNGASSVIGIDVSHHQGEIDWQKVADSGVEFVMVRLGYRGIGGGTLHTDRNVQQNLQGAKDAGLKVGAYFYSQATGVAEAREEARLALEILGDFPLDLPLAFDWEIESRTENVDVQTATDCAIAFCTVIEDAGLDTMIYFNSYQARQRLDLLQLTAYPWWLALYTLEADFPCRFDVWQYTKTGRIPGINADVDINVMLTEDGFIPV